MYFKSLCITFGLLMFMACGGGGGGSSSPKTTPNIALSEKSYDFSGIVKDNTADHRFEIRNTGKADLTIGQITGLAAPYSIPAAYDGCSNKTLKASGTCTFRARFAPTNQGVFADQILIPSNDPDEKTAKINLLGTGYGLNVWIRNAAGAAGCIINLDVTVTESDGTLVGGLVQGDFDILVNGTPPTINNFTPSAASPVSLVLAIDWSKSEEGVIGEIRTAANNFIDELGVNDEAAICKFNNIIQFSPPPPGPPLFYALNDAGDVTDMKAYINTYFAFGSGTYLYDAVYDSITRAAAGSKGKKVVVVLSDGVDSGSPNHTLNAVIAHATDNEVPVFTIYYRDPDFRTGYGDPNTLETLADDTGGQHFVGDTPADLAGIYEQIASTIGNKYEFELEVLNCSAGTASLEVYVEDGVLYGEDSASVTLTP
mgnify:CR=1 FL=1